jgi:hypothetical protein
MKNLVSFVFAIFLTMPLAITASALTDVPTSEIEGVIAKVVPSEREIYVESAGKKHEYYFNVNTKVTQGSDEKKYEDLKQGMRVKVSAHRIGKRLDPFEVRILE